MPDQMMNTLLEIIADRTDSYRPGTGDCVRARIQGPTLSRPVAILVGQAASEIIAGRMTYGEAVETVVQSVAVDADELDVVRQKLRAATDERESHEQL